MIITNPLLEPATRWMPSQRLIYYNFDDYTLYVPQTQVKQMVECEDEMIQRSILTLCSSASRAAEYRVKHPSKTNAIIHFPNATRQEWIDGVGQGSIIPNTVGYVGNMIERVDWNFVYQTAELCPHLKFFFVGDVRQKMSHISEWMLARQRALSLPNVEAVGHVSQSEVWLYYQRSEVNWMPYDVNHPFNIASCPTKIFDALGAGRPFVSTPLPECLLYPEHVHIARTPEEAAVMFETLGKQWNKERETRQLGFARANSWNARAELLLSLLTK
jgi:teichuronic acid biosynthesis glycosyltransferase TuaH